MKKIPKVIIVFILIIIAYFFLLQEDKYIINSEISNNLENNLEVENQTITEIKEIDFLDIILNLHNQ